MVHTHTHTHTPSSHLSSLSSPSASPWPCPSWAWALLPLLPLAWPLVSGLAISKHVANVSKNGLFLDTFGNKEVFDAHGAHCGIAMPTGSVEHICTPQWFQQFLSPPLLAKVVGCWSTNLACLSCPPKRFRISAGPLDLWQVLHSRLSGMSIPSLRERSN